MITTTISIRADQKDIPIRLFAVEGESQSREFQFAILGPSGEILSLSNAIVSFYIEKPDKNLVMLPAAIENDKASVVLTLQSCSAPGEAICWLQIVYADKSELRIDNMRLFIQPCNLTEATESTPEFSALQEALGDMQIMIDSKGQPGGLATLDEDGKLSQMPTAEDVGALPLTGGIVDGTVEIKSYLFTHLPPNHVSGLQQTKNFNNARYTLYLPMDGTTSPNGGIRLIDNNNATVNQIILNTTSIDCMKPVNVDLSGSVAGFLLYKTDTSGTYRGQIGMESDSSGNVANILIGLLNPNGSSANVMYLYKDRTVLQHPLTLASGGTGAATAQGARANLGIFKLLYSGSWSTGAITVNDISIYNVYLIQLYSSTHRIVCLNINNSFIEGLGGTIDGSASQFQYAFRCEMSGNTLNNPKCYAMTHNSNGNHTTAATGLAIKYIWGLL